MKKVLLGLLVLVSMSVSAQIREVEKSKYVEIGKIQPGGVAFLTSLSVMQDPSSGGTNSYLWMYSNAKYTTITDIKSISFTATDEELNGLYELMKAQMSAEKGTEKSLVLGKSNITFKTIRALGVSSLTIYDLTGGGGFFYLSSRQLDKLFGKTE